MSARSNMKDIRQGMTVFTADGQTLGTVERVERNALIVAGQSIAGTAVARVAGDGVYLDGGYAPGLQDEGQMRVQVAEERLAVGTREVGLGEVQIRKTVTEEQQTIPVTLHRDEVHVTERDVTERPLHAGEEAFQEGTMRIELHGEEAVVSKEAMVTGEVVINKEHVAEERQVSDTVRREHVEVDESHLEARVDPDQARRDRQRS